MTPTSEPRLKITYAALRNDNEQLHASYDAGLAIARGELGGTHGVFINGEWRAPKATFEKRSPIDGALVGQFARGTRTDVRAAVAAARAAAPGWAGTAWRERVAIMRRMADMISERQMQLAALMSIEVGKNRLEALGDVEETADLIRYYCDQFDANDGFDHPMGNLGDATVHTRSVLKPHGVWAIISPFNFPMALSGGPAGGALVAGNAVVYKPSSDSPMCGVKLAEIADLAGLPRGVFNMVSGPGEIVGAELQENEGVDGLLFTGSYEIGFNHVFKEFSRRFPKPVIVEMGGKNPAIVSAKADLEEAAEGVMRSAFGFGGQKCSACSRVYVEASVYEDFLELLATKTRAIAIGDPTGRKVWLGPLVNAGAAAKYDKAVAEAKRDGRLVCGGERLTGAAFASELYVAPTVVADLAADHRIWRDELFVPLVAVASVGSLDQAIELANDSLYGLTAGFFSEDRDEVDRFEEAIEAGVIYINRRAGATTGAWPGIQPFGGWKGSGTTGRASGGLYYVQQFMREQSQTLVDKGIESDVSTPPAAEPERRDMPFNEDIVARAKANSYFREVLSTGPNSQVVVMSIPPGGEIGSEVHDDVDQVLVFVQGEGEAILDGVTSAVAVDRLVHVPAGTRHNFVNTSATDLRLYTIYAPPEHAPGTIHKTKAEADAVHKAEHAKE